MPQMIETYSIGHIDKGQAWLTPMSATDSEREDGDRGFYVPISMIGNADRGDQVRKIPGGRFERIPGDRSLMSGSANYRRSLREGGEPFPFMVPHEWKGSMPTIHHGNVYKDQPPDTHRDNFDWTPQYQVPGVQQTAHIKGTPYRQAIEKQVGMELPFQYGYHYEKMSSEQFKALAEKAKRGDFAMAKRAESKKGSYVLDRYEGDKAVIEYQGGTFSIPKSMVPSSAKEGSHLKLSSTRGTKGKFSKDTAATKKAATRVKGKLDKLKK